MTTLPHVWQTDVMREIPAQWRIKLWTLAAVLQICAGLTYQFRWPGGILVATFLIISGLLSANTVRLERKAAKR